MEPTIATASGQLVRGGCFLSGRRKPSTMDIIIPIIAQLTTAAYLGLILTGAWTDARELRIPNWISLSLLALFVPAALVGGLTMETIALHFAGALGVLVIGFALFAFGFFGGGDAKLMAAVGLWVGWGNLPWFAISVILFGGVLALGVVGLRRGLGLWPDWLVRSAAGLFEENKAIPYGIAITAGAILTLPKMALLPENWRLVINALIG